MKQIKSLAIIAIFSSILLFSCGKRDSSILKEQIKSDNLVDLVTRMKADKDVSVEEIGYFNNVLNQFAAAKDSLNNKTVEELINKERERIREASFANVLENAARNEINYTLAFSLQSMTPYDTNGQQFNILNYNFQNLYDKDVVAIQGFCEIYDQAGTIVKRFVIDIKKVIPVGRMLTQPYPYPHDPKNERDSFLRANFKALRIVWRPTLVEFTNGKKLTMTQKVAS